MIDDRLSRRILVAAAISGALGVLLGALGAHGLDSILESRGYDQQLIVKRIDQFNVGVRYHLIHAVALLALAALPFGSLSSRQGVARLFCAGLLLFSGSLYVLVFSNQTWLGAITPIGGVAWIVGWSLLVWVARTEMSAH